MVAVTFFINNIKYCCVLYSILKEEFNLKRLKGNVIRDNDISERMSEVFDYVGDAVASTYGPLGHTTLIQDANGVTATKDGWTVLQNITLDNIFDNSIKKMIESCAFAVVLLVGDGTTTVTKVSSILNKAIRKYRTNHPELTIRDLEESLKRVVNCIITELKKGAFPITEDNLGEAIKNIALVSTNWDTELSTIISNIYMETKNPMIKVETSGTTNTTYKIINGYDLAANMLVDNFYITDIENKICEVENPRIIIFDYKIQRKTFYAFYAMAQALAIKNQRLIIMAPDFDRAFIEEIVSVNTEAAYNKVPYVNFIPVQTMTDFNIDRQCIEDFSILLGTKVITRTNEDVNEFLDDVTAVVTKRLDPNDENYEADNEFKNQITQAIPDYIMQITGTCDNIKISEKTVLADGLHNANTELVEERRKILETEINEKVKDCSANNYLTDDIRQKRIRLGKLQGQMGVIRIGGYGDANIKAKKDALEDANRACEAAYRDGYNPGCCISTSRAINAVIANGVDYELTLLDMDILSMFSRAYYDVFSILFTNGNYTHDDLIEINVDDTIEKKNIADIYAYCMANNCGFDIIEKTYDTSRSKIINPVNVDIEVLKGCLRLLITSVTSNQFLFRNYQGFDILEDIDQQSEDIVENPNVQTTSYKVKKK